LDKDLRYVQINNTLAEMNGTSVEDHLGRTFTRNSAGDCDGGRANPSKGACHRGAGFDVEVSGIIRSHSDTRRHWTASFFPITGVDGALVGVGAITVEITKRKRAEESLQEAKDYTRQHYPLHGRHARSRGIQMAQSPRVNEGNLRPAGLFRRGTAGTAGNAAVRRRREEEEEEKKKTPPNIFCLNIYCPSSGQCSAAWQYRGPSAISRSHCEPRAVLRFLCFSPALSCVTTRVRFRGIVCLALDITERKQVEEELRTKEYLLSEAQHLGHVGSWFWEYERPDRMVGGVVSPLRGFHQTRSPRLWRLFSV